MKFLLFLVCGLICAGYLFTQQQVRKNVKSAIENNGVVIGMTAAEARKSLGEPLSTKSTQSLLGKEVSMTFADGNQVTFTADRATKIETVKLSDELVKLKRAMETQRGSVASDSINSRTSPSAQPPTAWKSQMSGTALDRRPYQKYNGNVYYSTTDDPDKLGTATESNRRNGLQRESRR